MKTILVVEDDLHIRTGVVEALTSEGFEVVECSDGAQAVAMIGQIRPSLVILDVMLPRKSGFDVCKEIRSRRDPIPILMLTAKGQEVDKVIGLELGADDYVTKPFGLRELIARVHALIRRSGGPGSIVDPMPETMQIGSTRISSRALEGCRAGASFKLTPRELAVLGVLFREAGNAVSRECLLREVWGAEYLGTTRTLDQVIVKLRQKVEPSPVEPRFLLTVHGYGYKLVP